jgi:hypothetical protein
MSKPRRSNKGRTLREAVPGELGRGYDRRYEKDISREDIADESSRASFMFSEAMKQPRGARSWP